jgi:transcriptional activator of cad operon
VVEDPRTFRLRIGVWCLNPASGEISREGETIRLEVRTTRLLTYLAERPGDVVSIDELLKRVWPEVIVTPDSVYQAVASLRRVLGDDPKQPTYIATVPRLGYRLLAAVSRWPDSSGASSERSATSAVEPPAPAMTQSAGTQVRARLTWAASGLCLAVVVAAVLLIAALKNNRATRDASATPSNMSVAVLPFLDLTEKMAQEEFADGITEEMIDRLSRIPGLRVPPPTSSFYFKNKRRSVAEIAEALNVTYVLDGSTRKSGDRLRVAARLIRAGSGVVVWSDSYDRPWGDTLTIQDDIAGEVTKALKATIDSPPSQ